MATANEYEYAVKSKLRCKEEGGAHDKWGFYISGRLVGWSMRSRSLRGNEQISSGILGMMAREMRCSTGTWKRILECTRTRRDYINELFHNGHITEEERDKALKEG